MDVRLSLIATGLSLGIGLGASCASDDAENAEVTGVANDDDDTATSGDETASNTSNSSASTTSVTTSTSGGTSGTSTSTCGTSTSTSTSTTTTTEGSTTDDSSDCPPGTDTCPCDDGECQGSLVCFDDVCGEPKDCGVDLYEDNNTEAEAADLGNIGSSDSKEGTELTAVLAGADDVDWFFYTGNDEVLSFVNPGKELTTVGGLRMCKYAECLNGLFETDVTCPDGTSQATSEDGGRPGCCGDDSFEIDLNCEGVMGDDAEIYIRVDQAQQDCVQYTIDYHY